LNNSVIPVALFFAEDTIQTDLGTDIEPLPMHCGLNRAPICFED